MTKLNIVHLTTVHPEDDIRIFEKEYRGLVAAGYNVTLIVQSNKDCVLNKVRIRALPKAKNRIHRISSILLYALRIALNEDADLYHLHDPELLPIAFLLSLLGKQVIYDMHENVPLQIYIKHWIPSSLRRYAVLAMRWSERLVLNHFAVIMAEHSYVDDYCWVKRREVILNLPIAEDLVRLSVPKAKKPTIGYIGMISRDRGILIATNAIKRLRSEGLLIEFECIGSLSKEIAADQDFHAATEAGWIRIPGRKPPREAWSLVARCHLGIAVLQPVGNYFKSYPTKLFEYMGMGLPVVASNFPFYQEVIERHRCGICVDPENVEQLSDAIRFLLEHPDVAEKMGRNGQQAVMSEYAWSNELKKLTEFYSSILYNSNSSSQIRNREP